MNEFFRYDLRTTDPVAAKRFYATVLGHERAVIWPLHEQARARGASPHWLGQIALGQIALGQTAIGQTATSRGADVEVMAAAFEQRGGTRLGPTRPSAHGGEVAVVRDPGGAIVAFGSAPQDEARNVDVAWHVLNTNDVERATTNYRELFGWHFGQHVELGPEGSFQRFAWADGEADVGVVGDIAGRPGVHPQWLFFFAVASLALARDAVIAEGGLVLAPFSLSNGDRLCVCDDAQGAAFGLYERR